MTKNIILAAMIILAGGHSQAQDSTQPKGPPFHDIFVSGIYSHLNDGFSYGMGIAGAYYKNIYAETRWNYEDLNTFSLLGGYSFGNDAHAFKWELVPMFGFSIGNTNSVIPALEANLEFRKFNLYSESEYVISTEDKSDDFLYSWNEFTYGVTDWFHPGMVAQRTRLYRTGRDIDRGFMATFDFLSKLSFSGYLFDPFDSDRRFFVLSLGVNF